jgi:hypothetical protein
MRVTSLTTARPPRNDTQRERPAPDAGGLLAVPLLLSSVDGHEDHHRCSGRNLPGGPAAASSNRRAPGLQRLRPAARAPWAGGLRRALYLCRPCSKHLTPRAHTLTCFRIAGQRCMLHRRRRLQLGIARQLRRRMRRGAPAVPRILRRFPEAPDERWCAFPCRSLLHGRTEWFARLRVCMSATSCGASPGMKGIVDEVADTCRVAPSIGGPPPPAPGAFSVTFMASASRDNIMRMRTVVP